MDHHQTMNKPTLWIFGDSFSYTNTSIPNNPIKNWVNYLAEKLNVTLNVNSPRGSSIGWMMYTSMKLRHEYNEDDFIIFQTTSPDRGFLSKENPSFSKPDSWTSLSKNQQQGYNFYLTDIHDFEVLKMQFQSWIHAMAYYTKHLKLKPLLTTAWDLGAIEMPDKWRKCKGNLYEISLKEYSGSLSKTMMFFRDAPFDPQRFNHFSTCNHHNIADIYYQAFCNETYVPDFTKLEQNIYNEYPELAHKKK